MDKFFIKPVHNVIMGATAVRNTYFMDAIYQYNFSNRESKSLIIHIPFYGNNRRKCFKFFDYVLGYNIPAVYDKPGILKIIINYRRHRPGPFGYMGIGDNADL